MTRGQLGHASCELLEVRALSWSCRIIIKMGSSQNHKNILVLRYPIPWQLRYGGFGPEPVLRHRGADDAPPLLHVRAVDHVPGGREVLRGRGARGGLPPRAVARAALRRHSQRAALRRAVAVHPLQVPAHQAHLPAALARARVLPMLLREPRQPGGRGGECARVQRLGASARLPAGVGLALLARRAARRRARPRRARAREPAQPAAVVRPGAGGAGRVHGAALPGSQEAHLRLHLLPAQLRHALGAAARAGGARAGGAGGARAAGQHDRGHAFVHGRADGGQSGDQILSRGRQVAADRAARGGRAHRLLDRRMPRRPRRRAHQPVPHEVAPQVPRGGRAHGRGGRLQPCVRSAQYGLRRHRAGKRKRTCCRTCYSTDW